MDFTLQIASNVERFSMLYYHHAMDAIEIA